MIDSPSLDLPCLPFDGGPVAPQAAKAAVALSQARYAASSSTTEKDAEPSGSSLGEALEKPLKVIESGLPNVRWRASTPGCTSPRQAPFPPPNAECRYSKRGNRVAPPS